MPTAQTRYTVLASRTEIISFELDASSPADADERYLFDGEETGSETTDLEVLTITETAGSESGPADQ